MDISELKAELLANKIRPFYVFTGDEIALQDVYIQKIKELTGLDIKRVESIDSIYSNLTAKTLFKVKPSIFIVRNDDVYLKSESSWKRFVEAKSLKGNILIALYTDVEKTSKFAKAHEAILTQFDYIGTSLLKNRIHAITKMPLPYCEDLVKLCGNNYGRIKNELGKLQSFACANNYSWNTSYLEAKRLDMIHEDVGDIIFDFTSAIEKREIKKAYELWPKMKYTEDGPLRVITVLYNSFRQILMVQSTPVNERTEAVLGMTNGQIYITNQKCNKYNIYEVVYIVKTLRYLEKGIKTGTIAQEYAMEYLMGHIW